MAVEADLGLGSDFGDERGDAVGDLIEDQRTSGVDDVDALAAGVDHDPRLLRERVRRLRVGHHQEADRLEPQLAGDPEVLDRDVGLCAVGRDPQMETPASAMYLMSYFVPTPGSMSTAILDRVAASTAVVISSRSSVSEKP